MKPPSAVSKSGYSLNKAFWTENCRTSNYAVHQKMHPSFLPENGTSLLSNYASDLAFAIKLSARLEL